jgi:hypothetical protein
MKPDAASAARAVDMFDLLIEFFEDGKRWITGEFADAAGNRCLVGAMRYIRAGHNLHGVPARYYLLRAMRHRDEGLMMFNDCCKDFDELGNLILNARKLAVTDIEKARFDLAARELVSA